METLMKDAIHHENTYIIDVHKDNKKYLLVVIEKSNAVIAHLYKYNFVNNNITQRQFMFSVELPYSILNTNIQDVLSIIEARYKNNNKKFVIVPNAYEILNLGTAYDYLIVFGNSSSGYYITNKADVAYAWGKAIRLSTLNAYGDISLYYNHKLIRSICNANIKTLNKSSEYKYVVHKYNCNEQQ